MRFETAPQFELFGGLSLGSGLEAGLSLRFVSSDLDAQGSGLSGASGNLTMLGFSLEAAWSPTWDFFVRPLIGIGLGAVRSGLELTSAGSVISDASSFDLSLAGSGMLRFVFVPGLCLDLGVRFEMVNTMGGTTLLSGPIARIALWL